MSDQLNHNSDSETEWSNRKNIILEQIEDKWTLEKNEKVYIFDGPFSDLHSHIRSPYAYFKDFFEKYWENNIPVDPMKMFYMYVDDGTDDQDHSELYVGCIEKTMRDDIYINVVYKKKQDVDYNMTYNNFVFSTIQIGNENYCLAKIDYLGRYLH